MVWIVRPDGGWDNMNESYGLWEDRGPEARDTVVHVISP